MNEFLRCRRDCFLGVKAHQNIKASLLAFERLCVLVGSDDHLLLSSIFHVGVIRYAKPFLNTESCTGRVTYPVSSLKKLPTFSVKAHEHIITVRNTLVAHDDFEQIEPRMLLMNVNVEGSSLDIPVSIAIANKCISHLSDLQGTHTIRNHVMSALQGVGKKLSEDIKRIRSIAIEHPNQVEEAVKYSKNYGKDHIPVGGKQFNPPDFLNEQWLDPIEPDFSEVHNGFRYERVTFRQDFYGPERIKLPNGYEIEITPPGNN